MQSTGQFKAPCFLSHGRLTFCASVLIGREGGTISRARGSSSAAISSGKGLAGVHHSSGTLFSYPSMIHARNPTRANRCARRKREREKTRMRFAVRGARPRDTGRIQDALGRDTERSAASQVGASARPETVLFRLWCPERLCELEVVVAVKAVRAVQSSAARVRIRLGLGGWPVACAGGVDVDHLADVRLELQQSKS